MNGATSPSSGAEIRLSGDSHVAEPPDLWEKNLPSKYRDRAMTFPRVAIGKGNHAREGGWDAKQRLRDMAADGISADVLYPTLEKGIYERFYTESVDPELAAAHERVYNDWLIDYCSVAPERLWGLAALSLWDIDYAIAELQRTRDAGLAGAAIWVAPPEDLPWTSDHYERFWSAAEDLGVPMGMHINVGFGDYTTRLGERRFDDRFLTVSRQAYGHKVVAMRTVAELILSGTLERHPNLKIVLAEFEVGWIPFFLEDLDRKLGRNKSLGLTMLPSEYFSRQVYSTFMQDGVGAFLLQRWGADNFIYSNDYPHPGGIWPYTDDTIELTLSDLPAETRQKVLGGTLAKVYGRPAPAPMERLPRPSSEMLGERTWLKKAGEFSFDKPSMGLAV
jgi:predicted TIM-barrel fold metal-dependent hydrolase